MAFNADDETRRSLFGAVPQGIDILVSHCPPAGVLDVNDKKQSCGCPVLAENLPTIDPRLHVFGHIHKSAGAVRDGDRISVNAALPGEKFTLSNPPTVVDLTV
jgi:Icc-related predicted phosphoesterase